MRLAVLSLLPVCLAAQLIPAGQPVPNGPNPPVVFLNGYQIACSGTDFASNFGVADQLLKNLNIVTLYFDNCSVPGRPSLEGLGLAFGQFLAALKYTDGTPVTQVDIVAHSMGGLIVRAYLAGMQDTSPAFFKPPATIPIRRAVFLGTPHFGTKVANLFGNDKQTQEMSLGSQFLFDLNTWNQGTDDLRGVSAIAIAANGGTGVESGTAGFDDGVVTLTSSSLSFVKPGLTRIVPFCHSGNSFLTTFGACSPSAPPLNIVSSDLSSPVVQIVASFLAGTDAWKSTGSSGDTNTLLTTTAGLYAQLRDNNDAVITLIGGSVTNVTPAITLGVNSGSGIDYSEALAANASLNVQLTPLSGAVQTSTLKLPAGTVSPTIVKPGPVISPRGVIPAAGPAPFPYDLAPGAYVSIYGTNLASAPQGAPIPYPNQIADVQVLVNGSAAPLVFVSAGQINFVYPTVAPGPTQLTVKNANGQHTVNVRVAPAVPSIFWLDANGRAAALNALTGVVVGPNTPLRAGDFLSLYLTGLGATTKGADGLERAQIQPKITVGGQNLTVLYAGRTPGFAGLDQINCQLPAGITTGAAVPVVVTANGRDSAMAFIAVQ
jgi:uncharacterized protein (TIGR03437 family)